MPKEQSAGAVIFRTEGKLPQYLLLRYPSSVKTKKEYWDFPKGHIEKGETEEEAARREVEEETGLRNIKFFSGFREKIRYFFKVKDKTIFKTVVFYLGETKNKNVKISSEHTGYKWLSFEQAITQLKFVNAKRILKKAHDFLSSR